MRDRLDRLWTSFKVLQARRASRRLRRSTMCVVLFTVLLYYGMAIGNLFPRHAKSHLYGPASFISALTAVGYAWFWMRLLRRIMSTPSWNERAQMDFGKAYSQLSRMHQFDVRARVKREVLKWGGPRDERDALRQGAAERRAYQTLKIGLPIFVSVYWVVCLCLPVGLVRVGLLIGGVAMSGLVIPVMVLPDVIRLWTEPDEVGELKVVSMDREA